MSISIGSFQRFSLNGFQSVHGSQSAIASADRAHSGAKPELQRASLEVLGADNGVSATALKQIPIKKFLRNPKTTSVTSFSNLSENNIRKE
jgi:hypothetical protein